MERNKGTLKRVPSEVRSICVARARLDARVRKVSNWVSVMVLLKVVQACGLSVKIYFPDSVIRDGFLILSGSLCVFCC